MSTAGIFKVAGLVLALIPIGFFLLFAIGEGAAGWSHYLQAAIPLLGLLCAWFYPRLGGTVLMGLGILFGVWYPLTANDFPLPTIVLVELIVAAPAIIGGYLFRRSAAQGIRIK